jgi:hypothetical protein
MKVTSPADFIKRFLKKFDKTDKHIILAVFIAGLISSLYFIIGRGVAHDALDNNFFFFAEGWETALGRFSLKYLDYLQYGLVSQLLVVLASLAFISGAMLLIRRIFNLKNKPFLIIASCLMAVAPQFNESYFFLYCADAYLLAFFLCTLATYALTKFDQKKSWKITAILSVIGISSLYQPYLGVLAGFIIILAIKDTLESKTVKEPLLIFIRNTLVTLFGVIVYYILFKIICKIEGVAPTSYGGADSLGINTLLNLPAAIAKCFGDFVTFFFKRGGIINHAYFRRHQIQFITAALVAASAVIVYLKSKYRTKSKLALLLFLVLIFPIGVSVMNLITDLSYQTNLITCPGFTTVIILVAVIIEKLPNGTLENLLSWGIHIALVYLIWLYTITNVYTFTLRNCQYDQFENFATEVVTTSKNLPGFSADLPWMFSYYYELPKRENGIANGFITDTGISWNSFKGIKRYHLFFEKYLNTTFKHVDEDKYAEIIKTKEFKEMPIYPASGSIKIIDNTVVIKVSDQTF